MPLTREGSLGVGLATAGLVIAIHMKASPTSPDVRTADPNDTHIAASERMATWTSVVAVGAISLIAKDPTIFVIGGATAVAMAWWSRYDNTVNPFTALTSQEGMVGPDAAQVPVENADDLTVVDDFAA
jgi:hypothetical protein